MICHEILFLHKLQVEFKKYVECLVFFVCFFYNDLSEIWFLHIVQVEFKII